MTLDKTIFKKVELGFELSACEPIDLVARRLERWTLELNSLRGEVNFRLLYCNVASTWRTVLNVRYLS